MSTHLLNNKSDACCAGKFMLNCGNKPPPNLNVVLAENLKLTRIEDEDEDEDEDETKSQFIHQATNMSAAVNEGGNGKKASHSFRSPLSFVYQRDQVIQFLILKA